MTNYPHYCIDSQPADICSPSTMDNGIIIMISISKLFFGSFPENSQLIEIRNWIIRCNSGWIGFYKLSVPSSFVLIYINRFLTIFYIITMSCNTPTLLHEVRGKQISWLKNVTNLRLRQFLRKVKIIYLEEKTSGIF